MEKYKVNITEEALTDMEALYNYIAYKLMAPENALGQYDRIAEAILTLDEFPDRFGVFESEPECSMGIHRMVVDMCGLLATFTLKKEDRTVKHEENDKFNKIHTETIKSIICNPLTLIIMISFSIVSIVYIMINFFYVEKLQLIGIDEKMMTFIILGYSVIQLLSEKILDLFEGKYRRILPSFFAVAGVLLVVFGFVTNKIIAILIMLILPLLVDVPCFILEEMQNKIVDENKLDEKRAEILSIMNMGVNLVEVIFLFDSAIFSKAGVVACFFVIGIVVVVISVIIGILLVRRRQILSADQE